VLLACEVDDDPEWLLGKELPLLDPCEWPQPESAKATVTTTNPRTTRACMVNGKSNQRTSPVFGALESVTWSTLSSSNM
jgi:hypothetical protein